MRRVYLLRPPVKKPAPKFQRQHVLPDRPEQGGAIGNEFDNSSNPALLGYDNSIMFCVRNASSAEEIIKKSRFIGYLIPSSSNKEIQAALNRLASEHPNATHIAFAFRVKTENGIVSRFFDAGEPGGTAGKPIFQHLEGRDLVNCLAAVVRYFGGIKLGAGGLTRAYGNTARKAIEANDPVPFVEYRKLNVAIDYAQLQDFEYQLKKLGGNVESRNYGERIELIAVLPETSFADMKELIDAKWS